MRLDGEAAKRWASEVGDRVVSEQIVPCWKCRYCLRGQYRMCLPHEIYGFKRRTPGAMADYMTFPVEALVHKVAKHLLPGACRPRRATVLRAARGGTRHHLVVVAGCGPIGLGMIAGAAAKSWSGVELPDAAGG